MTNAVVLGHFGRPLTQSLVTGSLIDSFAKGILKHCSDVMIMN
jgi:hypothetical protein